MGLFAVIKFQRIVSSVWESHLDLFVGRLTRQQSPPCDIAFFTSTKMWRSSCFHLPRLVLLFPWSMTSSQAINLHSAVVPCGTVSRSSSQCFGDTRTIRHEGKFWGPCFPVQAGVNLVNRAAKKLRFLCNFRFMLCWFTPSCSNTGEN